MLSMESLPLSLPGACYADPLALTRAQSPNGASRPPRSPNKTPANLARRRALLRCRLPGCPYRPGHCLGLVGAARHFRLASASIDPSCGEVKSKSAQPRGSGRMFGYQSQHGARSLGSPVSSNHGSNTAISAVSPPATCSVAQPSCSPPGNRIASSSGSGSKAEGSVRIGVALPMKKAARASFSQP
jgi:hypothetical protein